MNNRDLRLLVTKACNYRCQFCHQEGLPEQSASLLTPEDYEFFYKTLSSELMFSSVTLTGGEPLLRDDIEEICEKLKKTGCEITLTTNGNLLGKRSSIGKYLSKVNISLHTLDKNKYEGIVQRTGAFDEFIHSVKEFRRINPGTKIVFNVTLVKGVNDSIDDLSSIVKFAKKNRANIKFIELFPSTDSTCVTLSELKEMLLKMNFIEKDWNHRVTIMHDGETNITLTRIFCEVQRQSGGINVCREHNDLFISPDGKIKPCRNKDFTISVLKEIKNRDNKYLVRKINESINCMGINCLIQQNLVETSEQISKIDEKKIYTA